MFCLIILKLLLIAVWIRYGWLGLMLTAMAMTTKDQREKFINWIPLIITVVLAIPSIYFLLFVW